MMTGVEIPRKDVEWLVKAMAEHYELPSEQTIRFADHLSGLSAHACKSHDRIGPMAIGSKDAKAFRIKYRDWRDNVAGGCKILASLKKHYKGDWAKALAAYETSRETVDGLVRDLDRKWSLGLPPDAYQMLEKVISGKGQSQLSAV